MPSGGSLRVGRILGIPILIHASWLLAFAVATLALAAQLDSAVPARGLVAAVTALAFFGSVLLHELGHAVVAMRLGVAVRSITLFVFGGVARLGAEPRRPRDELLVAAAGPLVSLVLGGAGLWLARVAPAPLAEPALWLGRVNVGIAVFNCLPGFPLDGGRILRAALWARRADQVSATMTAARAGQGLAYGLVALGAWIAASGGFATGLWIGLIGWFLLQAAQSSLADARLRESLGGLEVQDVLARGVSSVPEALDVASYVEGIVFPTGARVHLVRGTRGVEGVMTIERAASVPNAAWASTRLASVAAPLGSLPQVDVRAPLVGALEVLGEAPVVVAVEGGRFAGLVDRERLDRVVRTSLESGGARLRPRAAAAAALVLVGAVTTACDMGSPAGDRARALAVPVPTEPLPSTAPLQCATLRTVAESDVVRLSGSRLFFVDEGSGLSVFDLSDVDRPRRVATSPFVGTPLSLFVEDDIAWMVFVDWDARTESGAGAATVVRAVDARRPGEVRRLGDVVFPGVARDAELVGGVLYVLRDAGEVATLTSLGVRRGGVQPLDEARLPGRAGELAASSAGLAAVTVSEEAGRSVTHVAWVDLPMETPGALHVKESADLAMGFPVWERGHARVVSVDDDAGVRLVGCATHACGPSEPSLLRVVDFGAAEPRAVGALELTARGGLPVTRFDGDTLYVAEPPARRDGERTSSELRLVRLDDPARPRLAGRVSVRGTVASLVPRGESVFALGWTGSPGATVKIALHEIDVKRPAAPRVRAGVVFGADWTWSLAEDEGAALSFDPGSSFAAVPFTAWTTDDGRVAAGTQVFDLGSDGIRAAGTFASERGVQRAVFVGGRLVTVGADGIAVLDYAKARKAPVLELE